MRNNLLKFNASGVLAVAALVACLACGCSHRQQMTMRVFIDGDDVVKLSGNRLWLEHETFKIPEKPIALNGMAWTPTWKDNVSSTFEGINPAFKPRDPKDIRISKQAGRGEVAIVQMPSSENNGTLAFRISDGDFPGADWYEITVSW
jgi:nitrous oxide reductase accessory protein NosL